MHIRKQTFWGWYTALMVAGIIALCVFACGCQTVGICERLAVQEEQRGFMAGQPIFRVHYDYLDMPSTGTNTERAMAATLRAHAVNYLLHPDGTRTYYDVQLGREVKAPRSIWYDSYYERVQGNRTYPPTVADRR